MNHIKNNIPDILLLVAFELVSAGAMLWHLPLGLIVSGVAIGIISIMMAQKDGEE